MTDETLKAEMKKVVRCFQRYSSEQRADIGSSHRLGYLQRRAVGHFYYIHPDVHGICFPTRTEAAKAGLERSPNPPPTPIPGSDHPAPRPAREETAMGIAAYNRGTAALRRAIDAEQPDSVAILLGDLTAAAKAKGKTRLFRATVARQDSEGNWWVMNNPEKGWSSFGYIYKSLWQVAADWHVCFVAFGQDKCSRLVVIEPV